MMYRTHCQRILDTVIRANFDEVIFVLIHVHAHYHRLSRTLSYTYTHTIIYLHAHYHTLTRMLSNTYKQTNKHKHEHAYYHTLISILSYTYTYMHTVYMDNCGRIYLRRKLIRAGRTGAVLLSHVTFRIKMGITTLVLEFSVVIMWVVA